MCTSGAHAGEQRYLLTTQARGPPSQTMGQADHGGLTRSRRLRRKSPRSFRAASSVLVPTVLVPLSLAVHLVALRRLGRVRRPAAVAAALGEAPA